MSKRLKIGLGITISCLFFIIYFLDDQNNRLVITEMEVVSEKVPESFDNSKVIHLSDLHNKSFGKNQRKLVWEIEKIEPEIIVFTGDLIDSRRYDEVPTLTLLEMLVQIAPTYVVSGNHEWRSGKFSTFEHQMKEIGVNVLRNESVKIQKGNEQIYLTGIDDPMNDQRMEGVVTKENLQQAITEEATDWFNILLAHRPEMHALYSQYDFDIVFSGHAHGGQIRIPFIGGVIAPNQGFFPKYTEGMHTVNDTAMIVSRGLGNSLFPFRVFNRPEIIVLSIEQVK